MMRMRCLALWDTGATCTVISPKVIDALSLPIMGVSNVSGVGGEFSTTEYNVDLWLPNRILLPLVRVVKGKLGDKIDVLIGMDVISCGDFAISNFQGKTTFSFRTPSIAKTDYALLGQMLDMKQSTKVPRNSPCPCGSGRKYKNCCGK